MSRHGSVTPSVRSEDSQISHLAQDLSLSELKALIEKKAKRNHYLTIENEIIENYLLRRDPAILKETEQQQKLSRQKFEQEKSKSKINVPSSCHSTSSFYSPKKKIIIPLRIRNEILVRDLEDMLVRQERDLEVHEKVANHLRCVGEELSGRCCLLETALARLKDPALFGSFGHVRKFVETNIRQSKERIARIGLKMKTMQSNLRSVQTELAKKIDPGNAIKGVHFEIARIENARLTDTLEQTCRGLMRSKHMEDKLNVEHKQRTTELQKQLLLFTGHAQEAGDSSRSIGWLRDHSDKVVEENSYLGQKVLLLQSATSILETPSILDHMQLLKEVDLRSKKLAALSRQVALAQQVYKNKKHNCHGAMNRVERQTMSR